MDAIYAATHKNSTISMAKCIVSYFSCRLLLTLLINCCGPKRHQEVLDENQMSIRGRVEHLTDAHVRLQDHTDIVGSVAH